MIWKETGNKAPSLDVLSFVCPDVGEDRRSYSFRTQETLDSPEPPGPSVPLGVEVTTLKFLRKGGKIYDKGTRLLSTVCVGLSGRPPSPYRVIVGEPVH